MKTKHIPGLLAILFFCLLLISFPARADGNVLEWVPISKPGLRDNIVVSPSEVSEIAVGRSGTIYTSDSINDVVYQSLNGGATWEDITSRLVAAGAGMPASKIATAPDTTGTVAVVTDSGTEVYISTDGGATWTAANVPGLTGTIQAIAISKQYTEDEESVREVAIGTAVWGNNTSTGQLWVMQWGLAPSWQNQSLTVDPNHEGGEVSAIAYSPGYQMDNTIIVVASTGGSDVDAAYQDKTWLCTGKRDTAAGTTSWDYFSGYPVEIATSSSPSAGDDSGVSLTASLTLPSNYSGSDEDSRQLFVSHNREPDANDDVYRFDGTTVHRLNVNGGSDIDISSIAYYGTITSGKLLAGNAGPVAGSPTVQVRRTSNPFDSSPTWHPASTPPSGPGNAKVGWSSNGDSVYCGTGHTSGDTLDESAFSMSSDDGDNWQQLSLMDTTLTLSDITPASGSDTLFVATYSSLGPEGVWRSARTQAGIGEYWSRQLTMATASNRVILRLSPDYAADYTIYAAEAGGNRIAVSHNRGNSWKERRALGAVVDLVVEDEDTLYAALPGGSISKSTNSAFTWEEPVRTGLPDINMLAVAEKGTVLAGGRNGEVAYSADGGASFTVIDETIGTGDVQVVADAGYQQNGIIYAATDAADNGIWRWEIGHSTGWEQMDESVTAPGTGQQVGGLAMGSEGTLYALRLEPAGSNSGGVTRSLNPAAGETVNIEFDLLNDALPTGTTFDPAPVFSNTLSYLRISGGPGQNELWALDTANEIIYRLQDTLATGVPALISPADKFQNKINMINGRSLDIAFSWNNPSNNVTKYELGIYSDAACTDLIQLCPVTSTDETPAVIMGPGQSSATDQFIDYTAGATYYWRVRSTEPVKSSWSEVRSFTIEPVAAQVTSLLSPANGAGGLSRTPSFSWEPVSGANDYRFILADNTPLATPIVDANVSSTGYALIEKLEPGKTYFWAVKAIAPVESGWSAIANFTTREEPAGPLPPPAVVKNMPPPVINIPEQSSPPQEIVIPPYPPQPATIAPAYIWAIIGIAATLVIAVIALIHRTGRPF